MAFNNINQKEGARISELHELIRSAQRAGHSYLEAKYATELQGLEGRKRFGFEGRV